MGTNGSNGSSLPESLVDKIDAGEALTEAELRCLIEAEAGLLGISGEEAVERARRGALGGSYIAADLELLVSMLPAA